MWIFFLLRYQFQPPLNYYFVPPPNPEPGKSGVPATFAERLTLFPRSQKDFLFYGNKKDIVCLPHSAYNTNNHFVWLVMIRISDRSWLPVHHIFFFADLPYVSCMLLY